MLRCAGHGLLGEMAEHVDRLPHLVDVRVTRRTGHDVLLEARAIARVERTLEVLGDELDELLAGQIVVAHFPAWFRPRVASRRALRLCHSAPELEDVTAP